MRHDLQDNDHRDPVTERGVLPGVCAPTYRAASPGLGWMSFYSRVAGGIQMLYAAFFGWLALREFGPDGFYTPAFVFKGYHAEFYDWRCLIITTFCTLLSLCGFIGGYGLHGLRPWVRRWEVAYLGFLALGVAAETVWARSDIPGSPNYFARGRPADYTALVLFSLAFALPFLPLLVGVAGGRTSAMQLRPTGKKQAGSASDGVRE
jgi:hypothetical protein